MSLLLLISGILILIAAIIDILFTVLAPNGSGFLTGPITHGIWRAALFISRKNPKSKVLSNLGVFMVLFIVEFWVILLWIGNTLIIYSDKLSVMTTDKTEYITDFVSKLYYSAYVLSGMGNGDFTPATDGWQIYISYISFTGVIFLSLSISYLIPVVQAVTNKRKLALRVHTLGRTPKELLSNNWNDDNFEYLIDELHDAKPELIELAQQHLAYPVIHFFHSVHHYESTSLCVAKIDETLSILECYIHQCCQEELLLIKIRDIQIAMTYLLDTLNSGYIKAKDTTPQIPDLSFLAEYSSTTVINKAKIEGRFQELQERRKLLFGYVDNDSWDWEDVTNGQSSITINTD